MNHAYGFSEFSPPPRIIMTPGPVEADPRVLRAMSMPILGQFDPAFTELMNQVMELLRKLFQTSNAWAFPVDGTSRSGIEAVLSALIEPGETVLIPVYGRFGYLLQEIAERCGAEVIILEREWGTVFRPEEIIEAVKRHRPAVVAMVHGETSTGRIQPLEGIGAACRETGALLAVDAVATLGGVPVLTDEWQIDAVIGGSQKCLSVPSGMAPITYNERAEQKIAKRKKIERGLQDPAAGPGGSGNEGGPQGPAGCGSSGGLGNQRGQSSQGSQGLQDPSAGPGDPGIQEGRINQNCQGSHDDPGLPKRSGESRMPGSRPAPAVIPSNYLDLAQLQDYWSPVRLNHHTEMTSMLYALYEGVRLAINEGLEARFARHRINEQALMAGLAAMGLELYGDPGCKLPVVTCVNIPEGVDGEQVRSRLLQDFGIEIASSFGPLKGKIWRIGTMGYSCRQSNVLHLLGALEAVLIRSGVRLSAGAALQAALDVYEAAAV